MAFARAGMNCVAVGPRKLWIYNTDDTLTSILMHAQYNTANAPGMSAGDIILTSHTTHTALSLIMITGISAATSTFANYAALT